MKRTSIAIIALLLLTPILSALPVNATITERPDLYKIDFTINPDGTLTVDSALTYEFTVQTKWDRVEDGNLLLIDFMNMTISGAQVWLWISQSGGAIIEAGDVFYAGPFLVNDLITAVAGTYKNVTDPYSGETFWLGDYKIIGPITTKKVVPVGAKYYVKITDVSNTTPNIPSSDVAVSTNQWKALPSISISPSKGPAGTDIAVTGVAFDSAKLVNISFAVDASTLTPLVGSLLAPDANGGFVYHFYAPELFIIDTSDWTRYVNAFYNGTSTVLDYRTFKENGREWLQLKDIDTDVSWTGFGANDTATGVHIYVSDDIILAGNYFNPRGPITIYWEYGTSGQQVLTTVTPNATGFFNVTVVVPDSPRGERRFWAVDYSLNFSITAVLYPTLVCVPSSGPVGTLVTVYAYALDANKMYYVYFKGLYLDSCAPTSHGYMWIANATTGGDGKFNVTVQFTVPHVYGGKHDVLAYLNYYGTQPDSIPDPEEAKGSFTVTATVWTDLSIIIQDGTKFYIRGTGFNPCLQYWTNVDNQAFQPGNQYVVANSTGDVYIALIAGGFSPGLHVFALYPADDYDSPTFTVFNISTQGDPLADLVKSMNATVVQILTDPNGQFFVKMDTAVGQITTKIDQLNATVLSIKGDVADVKTSVGTFSGKIVAIDGNITSIKTDVGTIKADAAAAKTAAQAAQTAATAAQSGVSGMTTTLYIAVVLSLIAAVAAAICAIQLMRKLAG